jgi:hypothetical protein
VPRVWYSASAPAPAARPADVGVAKKPMDALTTLEERVASLERWRRDTKF